MGQGHRSSAAITFCRPPKRRYAASGIECIDLYQSHWGRREIRRSRETLAAYDQLIRQGKVRAIGASNLSASRLAQALAVSRANNLPRYETLQPEYNLYARQAFEGGSCSRCACAREHSGSSVFFRSRPGSWTGKYRSEADFDKSRAAGRE
jgi:aryl-alcohol dehydrogenase-like predicted oxidoreductase